MKKREATKELEYEEAPSGFVKLYNYKEPFMPFEEGFGFQGVLLFDGETDKVQCHVCGEWFKSLGRHLHEHGLTARKYKDMVGLRQTTALIGEKMRERLIKSGTERFKNLRPGKPHSEETKKKIREALRKNQMETKNERNSCPMQLISRYLDLKDRLGRTPVRNECTFATTAARVFGSWQDFLLECGETRMKINQFYEIDLHTKKRYLLEYVNPHWTKEKILEEGVKFYEKHGRPPASSDARRKLTNFSRQVPIHYFGSWKNYVEEVEKAK